MKTMAIGLVLIAMPISLVGAQGRSPEVTQSQVEQGILEAVAGDCALAIDLLEKEIRSLRQSRSPNLTRALFYLGCAHAHGDCRLETTTSVAKGLLAQALRLNPKLKVSERHRYSEECADLFPRGLDKVPVGMALVGAIAANVVPRVLDDQPITFEGQLEVDAIAKHEFTTKKRADVQVTVGAVLPQAFHGSLFVRLCEGDCVSKQCAIYDCQRSASSGDVCDVRNEGCQLLNVGTAFSATMEAGTHKVVVTREGTAGVGPAVVAYWIVVEVRFP